MPVNHILQAQPNTDLRYLGLESKRKLQCTAMEFLEYHLHSQNHWQPTLLDHTCTKAKSKVLIKRDRAPMQDGRICNYHFLMCSSSHSQVIPSLLLPSQSIEPETSILFCACILKSLHNRASSGMKDRVSKIWHEAVKVLYWSPRRENMQSASR